MTWLQFVAAAAVIVVAGVRLARYGDVLGEKTGLGRSWIGVVLLAATTSLPELFTGFGATALAPLPNIAVGDVLGSCMFNLLILSLMDAVQPHPLGARAHQGHALSVGFGLILIGVAGLGLAASSRLPAIGWVGLYSPLLMALYFVSMRVIFKHEQHRRARETQEVAEQLQYADVSLRTAAVRYGVAAVAVIGAALWLPQLGAELARETGLGEAFVGSLLIAITTSLPEIVVSLAAVRIGAIDLGIANVLGSNLFNLLILGLDDVFYREGPLLSAVDASHGIAILAVVTMNGLFLTGLTYRVITKRFAVTWDTGAIAGVYVAAVTLAYVLR
ncbi:MAG: sodium:calcium antiporter [Gemmatimonadetes bacterium]|nr:sodium:calcium antiporter [Gemmatimonadota bacterium]